MDIYSELLSALQTEDHVMLATIISTTGSTPAAALSKMLLKQGGAVSVGTVGGGCMEGDVLHAVRRLYQSDKAEVLTFQLNETNLDQGLICGGTLDVLIEPITRKQSDLIAKLKDLRDDGEDVVLATYRLADGRIAWKHVLRPNPMTPDDSSSVIVVSTSYLKSQIPNLDADLEEEAHKAYHRHQTRRLKTSNGELLLEPVLGAPSLIIFGGGHVSKYVSKAASMVGFGVTVVDDRPEYANVQRFPEAVRTMAVEFVEAFDHVAVSSSTFLVIVTRGHRSDEELLEQAVKTPAKYIGMIGSKRKVFATYERLVERGVPIEALKKVHAPIGLEIGAVTAEEIGVSIVAEMIAARRGFSSRMHPESEKMKDLFRQLENKVTQAT